MRWLELAAKACAILAGLLLTVVTLMTCISVMGRNTTGWTISGDFELSGYAAGAAIALFLPWCQYRRGNIIVDFFTTKAAAHTQRGLDRLGAFLLALAMGLMTWRSAIGGLNAWKSGSGSMMLGLPEWVVYAAMVPALALTSLIALMQALRGFDRVLGVDTTERAA
jgi:TRAP-type C4-dicarboxylate transport system permease small subunit